MSMSTPAQDRVIPAPQIYPDNKAFWAGIAAGKLLIPHCTACGKPHWYPRPQCPFCMSEKVELRESAGTGGIYTFSISRRVGPVVYAIAYVRLDDGVTMMSNIVDCDLDEVRIGQRLRVVMKATEGGTMLPMFAPV